MLSSPIDYLINPVMPSGDEFAGYHGELARVARAIAMKYHGLVGVRPERETSAERIYRGALHSWAGPIIWAYVNKDTGHIHVRSDFDKPTSAYMNPVRSAPKTIDLQVVQDQHGFHVTYENMRSLPVQDLEQIVEPALDLAAAVIDRYREQGYNANNTKAIISLPGGYRIELQLQNKKRRKARRNNPIHPAALRAADQDMRLARGRGEIAIAQTKQGTLDLSYSRGIYTLMKMGTFEQTPALIVEGQAREVRPVLAAMYVVTERL